MDSPARRLQETALVPEIAHLPTLVVNKFTYSPFVGTRLEETLANFGIRDIAVCADRHRCLRAGYCDRFDRTAGSVQPC